jgi:thiol-disulfide isomerase/thioredoxin
MSGGLEKESEDRRGRTLEKLMPGMRIVSRSGWNIWWVAGAMILALLLATCSSAAGAGVSSSASPADTGSSSAGDKLASDLAFTLYQGADILGEGNLTVSSLQGKPLVINFWAGLCPPCRAEMPDLQEFYDENKDRVNLLGIDVGQFTGLGNQDSAKALLEDLNVTYPAGFTSDAGVMRDYKILGMPTTVFIDSKGEVFRRWGGVLNNATLTKITNEMIENQAVATNY